VSGAPRVVLVDDHGLFRSGVRAELGRQVEVIGEADDVQPAIDLIGELLPDVVLARFQHGYALTNAKQGTLKPADLNGRRIGIRSFTTTTGAWLRGILANDYGVDLSSIDWVTFEDAHVAEFVDTTKRAPAGSSVPHSVQCWTAGAIRWPVVAASRPGSPPSAASSRA